MTRREQILKDNAHLRDKLSDDEIIALSESLEHDPDLNPENCSDETWEKLAGGEEFKLDDEDGDQ